MLSKFANKPAQKSSIFSTKASFERSLMPYALEINSREVTQKRSIAYTPHLDLKINLFFCMLPELFREQRRYTDHYFDHLDLTQVDKVLQECLNIKGLIIFTGVGKSGIIAEKIAMTMISTGTKALYLPPTNFLHGDIGILSETDLFVIISRSGETEELLNLVPFAKK